MIKALDLIQEWLGAAGLSSGRLEAQSGLLVLRLDPSDQVRLLGDPALRGKLTALARDSGFERVALELE